MADTNSILWQMADQIRARLGNADLYATKVSLATAVSEQIADTISDINNRMAVLEGGGGTPVPNLTSQAVTWTNLSEINLSGEKVTNGTFAISTTYEAGALLKVTSAFSQFSVGDVLVLARVGADQVSYELKTESTVLWGSKTAVESNTDVLPALSMDSVSSLPTGSSTVAFLGHMKWLGATDSTKGLTQGRIYETKNYAPQSTSIQVYNDTGSTVWIGSVAVRGTYWELMRGAPTNWDIKSSTGLDQEKLADGIIKGDGGAVSIQQTFSQNIAQGTDLVIKVTSNDDIKFYPVLSNGVVDNANSFDVLASNGFAEHTTQTVVSGFRISTLNGTREYSSVSVFQGDKSGGAVQATTNTLERISGAQGWIAGASSSQAIPGGQDGYFQFQYGAGVAQIGLTYQDVDFANPKPGDYRIQLQLSGNVTNAVYDSGAGFAPVGTWLRIRHYSGDNLIKFQKLQTIYELDSDFALPTTPTGGHANNHTFEVEDRPLVIALQTASGMTEGEPYRMHVYNVNSGNARLYELDGTEVGWDPNRGSAWEVVEEAGQDYVTFHTASSLTTNDPLYLDVSLRDNGSQINDATLVS